MSKEFTFFGYPIDTIYDDDGTTVIGYDVRDRSSHIDDQPLTEMRATIDECKNFIREWRQFRRVDFLNALTEGKVK